MEKLNASVGKAGQNNTQDVVTAQTLLNQFVKQLPPRTALPLTGICDAATIDFIIDFQTRIMKSPNPDGRIDPGGKTLLALNTPPAPNIKLYTSNPNERNTTHTSPAPADVVKLIRQNWLQMSSMGARTLTAQFMHETGGGKFCFNWNLGNVKSGPNDPHMYLINVWELDSPEAAKLQVAQSNGLGSIATQEEIKRRGWSCPPDKNVVVFQPPHPQCRFRAYNSLEDGAQKWLNRHKAIAEKNNKYIGQLNSGNTTAVAASLKLVSYYTGDEAVYAASMKTQKAIIDKALGPAT